MVEVTPAGTEVFEEVRAEIRANMRDALSELPDDELTELAHASETLGGLIETLLPAREA
jgi:DNA-binding MarR family transcriptional regulator